MTRTRVILESPYAGDVEGNVAYAREAMLDSIRAHGEAPIASHLLYTQMLDDDVPNDRAVGIAMGLVWRMVAERAVFYVDRGWSGGMKAARRLYDEEGIPWAERRIL